MFKAAEECRLDRDEEKAYVLYMRYLAVYDVIKKRPDFRQQQVGYCISKMWLSVNSCKHSHILFYEKTLTLDLHCFMWCVFCFVFVIVII